MGDKEEIRKNDYPKPNFNYLDITSYESSFLINILPKLFIAQIGFNTLSAMLRSEL